MIIRIAVVRQRFTLLQRWVCVIVISAEAGFGVVLASPLFKTPRGGNKPFTGILLLRVPGRRYVVLTIILDRICLFGLIIRIAVVRQWFALLQRWVCVIVISVEAGFGAALASPL